MTDSKKGKRANLLKLALAIVLGAYGIPAFLTEAGISNPMFFAVLYLGAGYVLHAI